MPAYLAAADVVVDNAGGLTSWEALTSGTPVVLFDPLPGHGRLNAATLAESGLVRLATTAQELRDAVRNPAAAPPPPVEWSGPPVEDLVMDLARHRTHAER
jgi:UDP-N-acetylglucosamine:LPS N-acetylglucosamine transferase